MAQGKTYNKSPGRINHKAPKSKTNTGTTALERSDLLDKLYPKYKSVLLGIAASHLECIPEYQSEYT